MKKVLLCIAVSALLAHGAMHASDLSKKEKELQERTQRLQKGITWKEHAKRAAKYGAAGAAVGAPVGALVGGYTEYEKQAAKPGPAFSGFGASELAPVTGVAGGVYGVPVGAAVGAAAGVTVAELRNAMRAGLRKWQLHKINGVLRRRTTLDAFEKLPIGQAMLIFAAYRRDVQMMKQLITKMQSSPDEAVRNLLNKDLWEALAELFFNEQPTKSLVERLKKLINEA